MTLIALGPSFGGIVPRTDEAQMPHNAAQVAENVKLHAGTLRGWRAPLAVYPTINVADTTHTLFYDKGSDVWFTWDVDVDIVLGPVADGLVNRRYYYTGSGAPKKTDSAMAIAGAGAYPQTYYELAVPAPDAAPTVASDGVGVGTAEDHVYVITYVSEFSGIEEESAPSSPVTMAAWQPGDTITLTWQDTLPVGNYNLTKRRVYRSNGASYFFVLEQDIDPLVLTATDALLNTALGEGITTLEYDTPPDSLSGLVTLANGILAGFVGNEICFCEPFQPHAWPVGYRLAVTEQIVALVAVGQGLYVLTEGNPYYCAGTHPDNMVLERITKFAPCMSKRSAATDGTGALYASYNGVTHLMGTQAKNITTALFTQEEWRNQSPESLYGIYYDDRYMLWYSATTAGPFTMNGAKAMDGSETMDGTLAGDSEIGGALVFDSTLPEAPLTTLNAPTTAAHIRADDGLLYMVDGDELARFDADALNKSMYEWRSKTFVLPAPVNMKAIQVYADNALTSEQIAAKVDYEDALAQAMANLQANILLWNAGAFNSGWAGGGINEWEWNGSALKDAFVQVLDPLTALTLAIKVYADGDLVFMKTVEDNKPMLLPRGFKTDTWEIEVSGNKPVRRIVMGTSMAEVKAA